MTYTKTFDINSDIGESFGNWTMGDDASLMPLLSTANIACGFHASDPLTMSETVRLAIDHNLAIGAHPGLPDLLGFGRRPMAITPEDAAAYIIYQSGALAGFLRGHGLELHHVKPHGAFYSILRDDTNLASAAASAIASLGNEMLVYWPAPVDGIAFCDELRRRGVRVVGEVYPDMTYTPDAKIILQRKKKRTEVAFAIAQIKRFLESGVIEAVDGTLVPLQADAACVHGDDANAIAVATAVRKTVIGAGFAIEAAQYATTKP